MARVSTVGGTKWETNSGKKEELVLLPLHMVEMGLCLLIYCTDHRKSYLICLFQLTVAPIQVRGYARIVSFQDSAYKASRQSLMCLSSEKSLAVGKTDNDTGGKNLDSQKEPW